MTSTSTEEMKCLDQETIEQLRQRFQIYTIEDFVLRTRSGQTRKEVAKLLKLKPKQLDELRRQVCRQLKPVTYAGEIFGWFETGTEGVVWALQVGGKEGYDGLVMIEDFDHLLIWSESGQLLFDGEIKPNYKKGWQRYPRNPKYGQPCALGMWVHWTQQGWEPDDWARLFFPESRKNLRASLTKNPPRI